MAISLYDISIANFLQTLAGAAGFLEKGRAHFEETKTDPNAVLDARVASDMLPFHFQVVSVVHHSLGAVEGVKKGVFSPPSGRTQHDYAGLQGLVADASKALKAVTPEEINAFEGKDMFFEFGTAKLPFTAENFILTFSLPNLHFHATTAYGILRAKGVPLGKRDYMGPLRLKK